ncbi:MAG: Maf family protein [Pseudomonadota bacterium]
MVRLVLASRSPRRAELLRRMGLSFEVRAMDVDESVRPGEGPEAYVVRLARRKAWAAAGAGGVVALGADTAVILDDRVLGKPVDAEDAITTLCALSGRSHRVMTGIAASDGVRTVSRSVVTEVRFRRIERWEAEAYWRTGEPVDKAGGYGIQGIGGIFAESIRGSYSAVVGLPLAETEELLRELGVNTWRERTHD